MIEERRKRVLVVDDDTAMRSIIRATIDDDLAKAGIVFEEEGTASEAYDRIALGERDTWFIVTDYQMPSSDGQLVRNGKDLVRCIRCRDFHAHIVFMTGSVLREEGVTTLGADRCLEKPFVFAPIVEELQRFLASD